MSGREGEQRKSWSVAGWSVDQAEGARGLGGLIYGFSSADFAKKTLVSCIFQQLRRRGQSNRQVDRVDMCQISAYVEQTVEWTVCEPLEQV